MFKYQRTLTLIMFALVIIQVLAISVSGAYAGIQDDVKKYSQQGGAGLAQEVDKTGTNVVTTVRQIFGTIAVLIVMVGGLIWATAHGDPNKIMLAKKIFGGAVIALIIVFKAEMFIGLFYGLLGITPPSATTTVTQ